MKAPSQRERIGGGLWGALVGDALGVPVEFTSREVVQANPVTHMRGSGTHHQPPGTWSDDGALTLCTIDSLVRHEFNLQDMGDRFSLWMKNGLWTTWGEPFDIGMATSDAILRIEKGVPAAEAGGRDEYCNGNGSLMRILPAVLRFVGEPDESFISRLEQVSSITHAHERSRMACVFYGIVIRQLLAGWKPGPAVDSARVQFIGWYERSPAFPRFRRILEDDFSSVPQDNIVSTGYVLHTLHASLWCLLTTDNFRDCVLKAVNLGYDTDTTGCVSGGLAGVAYGHAAIPEEWTMQLGRRNDLETLISEFVRVCETSANR